MHNLPAKLRYYLESLVASVTAAISGTLRFQVVPTLNTDFYALHDLQKMFYTLQAAMKIQTYAIPEAIYHNTEHFFYDQAAC